MNPVIRVDNLAKQYRLGVSAHSSLRELIAEGSDWMGQKAGLKPAQPANRSQSIWALQDVSFKVFQGEVVGIIGRNGNGKSTLLKILSRITLPTRGRVELYGKLSSLLEIGTGFHPELTGRENVFLNGAILGMDRATIQKRMDAIVDFAEIGAYLDTPVKRYSSGMYVRLAFSVAAHLEPDILVIDEVLAVGDGAFQKKCLGKIQSVGQSDRAVLFVSHSLRAVRAICSRTLLINEGRVLKDGPTDEVLTEYNRLLQTSRNISEDALASRLQHASGAVRFSSITCLDQEGTETWAYRCGDTVRLRLDYSVYQDVPSLGVYLILTSMVSGEVVTSVRKVLSSRQLHSGGKGHVDVTFPNIPLSAGDYGLTLCLSDAAFDRRFDYMDHSHHIPWLSLTAEKRDAVDLGGYFSIPVQIVA